MAESTCPGLGFVAGRQHGPSSAKVERDHVVRPTMDEEDSVLLKFAVETSGRRRETTIPELAEKTLERGVGCRCWEPRDSYSDLMPVAAQPALATSERA